MDSQRARASALIVQVKVTDILAFCEFPDRPRQGNCPLSYRFLLGRIGLLNALTAPCGFSQTEQKIEQQRKKMDVMPSPSS
jgi:hypothetical protein